jgi:hypothetical protein
MKPINLALLWSCVAGAAFAQNPVTITLENALERAQYDGQVQRYRIAIAALQTLMGVL